MILLFKLFKNTLFNSLFFTKAIIEIPNVVSFFIK